MKRCYRRMSEELKEFLHQRGIASTVIQRFVDDKGPGSPWLSSILQECGSLFYSESLPDLMGKYLTGEFSVSTPAAFILASQESETTNTTWSTQASFNLFTHFKMKL
ncbi:uncharacterized protein LOC127871498 [Dreissena polymorpha]|uniref:uncharacterized protein LOC127871498 n=1 Tax=Dreissena polymorpha TaxID=45954 RepID=UPI0022642982|nr:uncharacterized protein LOC127871498 [Dreissena polymorpha]